MTDELSEAERYPTLSPAGEKMLRFLREHPHAPRYRNASGNRLLPAEVERVRAFERDVLARPFDWTPNAAPAWVGAHIARCHDEIPHFRARGPAPAALSDVPTTCRADLSRDIAGFVPDGVPIDRLLNFHTSGTTGHPLPVPSHPVVAASYLAFHKRALARFGVTLTAARGAVGVVLLGYQRSCFTYVSVTPTMDEAGLAKINLAPEDWRNPADRAPYLEALAPEVIAGDPISFAALLTLPARLRPRALLSTAMALSPGLRARLEQRFGCAVLDLYSLNEAGPVAVADAAGGHVLLQPGMYVEIVDRAGRALPPGTRGEITLTGGFNFCLPLLRYRTGDYAALRARGNDLVLEDLAGRPPVRFRTGAGDWINNLDVTHALAAFPLAQHTLHQSAGGSFTLRAAGLALDPEALRRALAPVLAGAPLTVEPLALGAHDKLVQYTSDLPGAEP